MVSKKWRIDAIHNGTDRDLLMYRPDPIAPWRGDYIFAAGDYADRGIYDGAAICVSDAEFTRKEFSGEAEGADSTKPPTAKAMLTVCGWMVREG